MFLLLLFFFFWRGEGIWFSWGEGDRSCYLKNMSFSASEGGSVTLPPWLELETWTSCFCTSWESDRDLLRLEMWVNTLQTGQQGRLCISIADGRHVSCEYWEVRNDHQLFFPPEENMLKRMTGGQLMFFPFSFADAVFFFGGEKFSVWVTAT